MQKLVSVAVGAPGEASKATGVNPGPAAEANNSSLNSGAVYIFVRSGTTWSGAAERDSSGRASGAGGALSAVAMIP